MGAPRPTSKAATTRPLSRRWTECTRCQGMRLACPCGTAREAELWATVHRLDAALAMAERTAKRCAAAALALLLLVVGLLWCLTQRSG